MTLPVISVTDVPGTHGESYIVWINEYEISKSAGYLSKYMTKSCGDARFNHHERRYGFSCDDGFILDLREQFAKYGFVTPPKGTWSFRLGPPEVRHVVGTLSGDGGGKFEIEQDWLWRKLHGRASYSEFINFIIIFSGM